jgi:allophanate hydrolase subunit 2
MQTNPSPLCPGPTIKFHSDTIVALCGATFDAFLDDVPVKTWWASFKVIAGGGAGAEQCN